MSSIPKNARVLGFNSSNIKRSRSSISSKKKRTSSEGQTRLIPATVVGRGEGMWIKPKSSNSAAAVVMYSIEGCPYCQKAERLLRSKGVETIQMIRVDRHPERRQEMVLRTGRRTVPQIYIGERHIGGFDDLSALESSGGLDSLLSPSSNKKRIRKLSSKKRKISHKKY